MSLAYGITEVFIKHDYFSKLRIKIVRKDGEKLVLQSYTGDSIEDIEEITTVQKLYDIPENFLLITLGDEFKYFYEVGEYSMPRYKYIKHEGSSRSSKTTSLCEWTARECENNEGYRITVWRDTKASLGETVWKDFRKVFILSGRKYKFTQDTRTIFFNNGSTVEPQGDDTTNAHGLSQNIAWLNEPYKMSENTFHQIDMRAEQVIIDMNPSMAHWSDKLNNHPRCKVIHSTFKDNPFCPMEMKLKILSYDPSNPINVLNGTADAYKHAVYALGLKAEKPNRILSGWKKIPRKQYDDLQSTEYIGNDWGKNHNWGILGAKYYDGALYLREMNYASEVEIMKSLPLETLQEFKKQESKEGENLGIVSWMFAKLGINKKQTIVCDNNRPLKISMLRRCGWDYAVGAQKGQGSIKDGLDLLENIEVYYTDDSPNLSNEYENYSYIVDRYGVVTDEPEDANNHLIDPARYICQLLVRLGLLKRV
jgi:PBSX family phage terminase large subunit